MMPVSWQMPVAEGGKDEERCASGSYQPLEGNLYDKLDEASPPAPPDFRRPVVPEKPEQLRGSLDKNGYLNVRDTKEQSELKPEN